MARALKLNFLEGNFIFFLTFLNVISYIMN